MMKKLLQEILLGALQVTELPAGKTSCGCRLSGSEVLIACCCDLEDPDCIYYGQKFLSDLDQHQFRQSHQEQGPLLTCYHRLNKGLIEEVNGKAWQRGPQLFLSERWRGRMTNNSKMESVDTWMFWYFDLSNLFTLFNFSTS